MKRKSKSDISPVVAKQQKASNDLAESLSQSKFSFYLF